MSAPDVVTHPLSPGQRQLWLLQRLQPESTAYNISFVLRISGPLRVDVLRSALGEIVDQHDVLRTRYPVCGDEPTTQVSPPGGQQTPIIDLGGQGLVERTRALDQLVANGANRPFDLTADPVLRSTLVRLADHEHMLLLSIHHIAFDGASASLFFKQLEECYAGRGASLEPPGTSYARWAVRQNRQASRTDLEFWRDRLRDVPTLSLQTDRPPPPVRSERGNSFRFELGADLSRRVAELAEEQRTTPFVVLLSAFLVLLGRYTGSSDIVVGTPVSTRDRADLDRVIGYFVNTLALRVRLPNQATGRELIDQVNETFFDALEHANVPFGEVVRAVAPQRAGNHNPLTRVCFNAVNERHRGQLNLPGLLVERLEVERTASKFDLDVDVFLAPSDISCSVEYSTDLFEETTVRRMIEHWRQVVLAFTTNPEAPLSTFDPMTQGEREQILLGWNDTGTCDADPRRIHELFEAQALRTPEQVAVIYGENSVTYAELERRANQLAHALRARGVGTESVVGICLPRSTDLIVTLLAVLKAGGAFVPLDPELPPARLEFMLGDAGAATLLTVSELDGALPAHGPSRLLLDTHHAEWSAMPTTPPRPPGGPDNLACLIYTSGSTGTPKCAMLTHGNFTSYFHAFEHKYHLSDTVRVLLQMAAFSFDIFIADTMRSLFVGATLVMCPRDVLLSPPDLYELMVRTGVNAAEFVPPVLKVLLDHVDETGQTLEFLDLLAAGGDSWYSSDYRRAQRLCAPGTRLVDTYGTTETGIDNVTFTGDLPPLSGDVVPIGRPLANSELYVLDDAMRPVPVGVVGELYIGGLAVGRGYARRPGLTAERFVPDPFARRPGSRLYRTGDLGRFLPDGTAEIIGRADSQVKIRGFRIELGEIESVLRDHPQVDDGVVVTREREPGERALAAFVTAADCDVDVAGIRAHMLARLPRYMVPTAVAVVDHIPLSTNGKLDRGALPTVIWDDPGPSARQAPPATPEEDVIAGIMADVLGVSRVGVTDDFFELGGHSLLAMRVVSRVRAALGADLELMRVFDHPTVRELARCLVRRGANTPTPRPMVPVGRPDKGLPLSFAQQRLWFFEQLDPGTPVYNLSTVFSLRGELDLTALQHACARVVERHEVLRTVFRTEAGVPRQVVLAPYEPRVRLEDVADLAAAEHVVEQERLLPFDLMAGPLVRVAVLRLAEEEHLLVITMHHIATDGWSTPIFLREFADYYAAQVNDAKPNLPELPVQYADFAVWQRDWFDDKTVGEHLDYWREHLRGAPELLDLPLDRPRRTQPNYQGCRLDVGLTPVELTAVERFGQREGATLFMTLLTAFKILLAQHSGQRDIVVGTAIANRTHPMTENLIGFFVNTLPLRLDLSDEPTFRTAVGRVRQSALNAYAHQDLPFERLVEELRPKRDPSYQPLVQVLFTVQSTDEEVLDLPNIEATAVPQSGVTSKFDLSMEATKTGEGLACTLWYRTELFDAATIRHIADDWRTLLLAAIAAPDVPMRSLPAPRPHIPSAPSRPVSVRANADADADDNPLATQENPIHRVLTAVWSEVLHTPVTDVTADFFRLGGHSLLATQVAAHVDELLGVRITIRTLFENCTVDSLARYLEPRVTAERTEKLADALAAVDSLSDEEVAVQLAGDGMPYRGENT